MTKMKYILQIIVFVQCLALFYAQRVAPGVPPQNYEHYQQHVPQYQMNQPQHAPQQVPVHQQVPQQQHHQQQLHQQQIQQQQIQQQQIQQQQIQQQHLQQQQMQQQQMPVQQQVPVQQQAPVQHQQVHQPVHPQQPHQAHQAHQAHHAHHAPGQVLNANIAHEKEHIVEHMEVPMDTSKMSEQELQFHYFKMHDADNNNKLDGCELIKSLIHWHEQGGKERTTQATDEKIFKDDELVALIDPILGMDDGNHDGYIDYPEFVRAQQKAAASAKNP